MDAWFEGEEVDKDDGVPHLWAALACIAIIIDADAAGKLNDDRMLKGGHAAIMERVTTKVACLQALHAHRETPRHYTIDDNGILDADKA